MVVAFLYPHNLIFAVGVDRGPVVVAFPDPHNFILAVGADRGPVVIAFPHPHNFTLVESLRWLHLIVYHLIPEMILAFGGVDRVRWSLPFLILTTLPSRGAYASST